MALPTLVSPVAVSLRVPNVRQAAAFYQQIGFTYVMAVPDDNDDWLLCLLRFGSGSILLGALDHPHFPRIGPHSPKETGPRGLAGSIALAVPDLVATYAACMAAGCQPTVRPAQELSGDRSFSCLDPFGYEWQFTQASPRLSFGQFAHGASAAWS